MSGIVENLKDPSWWFSAFFIAIVASVIAGFAKDRLGLLAARFSSSMKLRLEKRLIVKKARIEWLVENETLLILTAIMAGFFTVISFLIIIMFLLSPMWVDAFHNLCDMATFDPSCKLNPQIFMIFAYAFFGVTSIYSSFKSSSALIISTDAICEYRRKLRAAKKGT